MRTYEPEKFKSMRQAAAAAGLIRLPTHFDALKREWKSATTREKNEFIAWVKGKKVASTVSSTPIIDVAGHLKPAVIRFISEWTRNKRITPGKIMKEIGFSNFDYVARTPPWRANSLSSNPTFGKLVNSKGLQGFVDASITAKARGTT